MLATGHIIAKPDPQFDLWHRQYTNRDTIGEPTGSPNYPRTLGRLVSGLFQQAPVTMETPEGAAPSISAGMLADLTDRGVTRGTAESVVYIRPAQVAGEWVPGLLSGSNVDAVWEHDRLTSAVVWRTHGKDTAMRAVTEHYTTSDDSTQSVDVQLWSVKPDPNGGYLLAAEITVDDPDIEGVEPDPLVVKVRELSQQDRKLFAWAWDIDDGRPVPVHYTNERLLEDLEDLHDVEHEDNQLPRNILAMAVEAMSSFGSDTGAGAWGRIKGFRKGRNMLNVPKDELAQHGTDPFIKAIRLEDDLVQRDRIEAKEIVFYEACGFSATTFGRNVSGRSDSGAAKRADSQLTLTTIAGPARRWAETLTDVAAELARLGAGVAGPVQVTEGLKTGAGERADMIGVLRNADAMSIREAVKTANPDWDDARVDDEVVEIRTDNGIPVAADVDL